MENSRGPFSMNKQMNEYTFTLNDQDCVTIELAIELRIAKIEAIKKDIDPDDYIDNEREYDGLISYWDDEIESAKETLQKIKRWD